MKSGSDGFTIKMRDGKYIKCIHNSPQGGHLPDYAPHPAIVLKMEDGTGLLLPIIVCMYTDLFICKQIYAFLELCPKQFGDCHRSYVFAVEMPSVLLMAAIRNVHIVCTYPSLQVNLVCKASHLLSIVIEFSS